MIKFENVNTLRYFYLITHKDLFDQWVLTIIRGGRHHRVVRHFGFNCRTAIKKEIEKISKRRIQRGYTLVQ